MVPNPYFGRGDLHGAWARQQDHIRQRSIEVNGTDPRVFWRGSCLNHENRDGRLATNHPRRATSPRGAREVDGQIQYTKVEAGRRACDVWKDAGSS